MDPFELHDGDVVLTAPTTADVDRVTELCQDPAVQAWTTVPAPYTRADAEVFLGEVVPTSWQRGSPTWGVRWRGRLVGMVGLDGVEHAGAEIGYWLGPDARGQGVMHRAVALALDAAFDRLRLDRVEWRAFVGNWPSWRVAWRHGFHPEGTVRGLGVQRGRRRDEWIGTLLREDARAPAVPWTGPVPVVADPASGWDPAGAGRDPEALVREFHVRFGLPVVTGPSHATTDRVHMRTALVAEEAAELVAAVYGSVAGTHLEEAYARAVAADDGTRDVVAVADALGDLVYVAYGMALELGIPLPDVLAEIHRANLSKLDADGRPALRADGKVLRGPGYRPPDVAGVLARAADDRAAQ